MEVSSSKKFRAQPLAKSGVTYFLSNRRPLMIDKNIGLGADKRVKYLFVLREYVAAFIGSTTIVKLVLIGLITFSGTAYSKNAFEEVIPMPHLTDQVVLQLTQDEQAWLVKHKTIRIAYDGSLPPYSFINEQGKIDGIAVEIMSVVSQRLGINFAIYPDSNWSSLYKAAAKRKLDIVATMVKRPERTEWFSFTKPYLTKSLVIVTKENNTSISNRNDIADKKVAVVSGYQYGEQLSKEFPNVTRLKVETMLDSLKQVDSGQVDAAVLFLGTANYLQAKYQLTQLKIAAFFDRNNANESIAVRKDWPILVDILQKGLDSLTEQEVQQIFAKWVVQGGVGVANDEDAATTQPLALPDTKEVVEIEQQLPEFGGQKSTFEPTPEIIEITKMVGVFLVVLTLFGLWISLIRKQKQVKIKAKNEMMNSVRNLQSAHNDAMHLTIEPPVEKGDDTSVEDIQIDLNPIEIDVERPTVSQEYRAQLDDAFAEGMEFKRDETGVFTYVSPAITSLLGYSETEFRENYRHYLSNNPVNFQLDNHIDACIQGKPSEPYELEILDAAQDPHWLEVKDTPIYDGLGHCIGIHGHMRDITAQKLYQKISSKASEDTTATDDQQPLTLADQLNVAISKAEKNGNVFVLIYLALERFRFLDDGAVVAANVEVIKEAGKRLHSTLRDTDLVFDEDVDKFFILLPSTDLSAANLIVEKIRRILQVPYLVGVKSIVLNATMGAAAYPEDGDDAESLVNQAQVVSSVPLPATTTESSAQSVPKLPDGEEDASLQLQQDLVTALDECKVALRASSPQNTNALLRHSQFSVHYQSRHNINDYSINSLEALIRWQHPELGMLQPREFIGLVKDIGLIDVMTYWIIQQVSLQAVVWENRGIRPKLMAINLTSLTLKQAAKVSKIVEIVKETGAQADWFVFSIPAQEVEANSELIIPIITHLAKVGFTVAIDNFGADSSVMSLLKTMPVKIIELEPSMVRFFPSYSADAGLATECITSLHKLNMTVIAKEVETERQLELLKASGCDVIQGHLLSSPLPAKETKELIENLPDFAWYLKQ